MYGVVASMTSLVGSNVLGLVVGSTLELVLGGSNSTWQSRSEIKSVVSMALAIVWSIGLFPFD